MDKQELRKEMRRRKGAYTPQELTALSVPIVERLLAHPRVVAAQTVLLYHSLPDEVCTHQALQRLADMGKRVLLPVVTGNGTMELYPFQGTSGLHEGAFHIMEPAGEPWPAQAPVDLAVVPGMAFDRLGHRLGRGKGYYDRLLAQRPVAYKLGLCFPFQMTDLLPTDCHDIAMDEVLCGAGADC